MKQMVGRRELEALDEEASHGKEGEGVEGSGIIEG